MSDPASRRDRALALLVLVGLVAFTLTVIDFLTPTNGIHGTEGVMLVMVSTALLTVTALLLWAGWLRGWVAGLFEVLIVLDFIGTGFAGWLLEDWLLTGLMGLGFLVWLAHRLRPARPLSSPTG